MTSRPPRPSWDAAAPRPAGGPPARPPLQARTQLEHNAHRNELLRGDDPTAQIILLACVYSAAATEACDQAGWESITVDYHAAEGRPRMHVQGDVRQVLPRRWWAAVLGCPSCTNTARSGADRFEAKRIWHLQWYGISLYMQIWCAPTNVLILEHSISVVHEYLPIATVQRVHPYMFEGGGAVRKAADLAIRGAPPVPTLPADLWPRDTANVTHAARIADRDAREVFRSRFEPAMAAALVRHLIAHAGRPPLTHEVPSYYALCEQAGKRYRAAGYALPADWRHPTAERTGGDEAALTAEEGAATARGLAERGRKRLRHALTPIPCPHGAAPVPCTAPWWDDRLMPDGSRPCRRQACARAASRLAAAPQREVADALRANDILCEPALLASRLESICESIPDEAVEATRVVNTAALEAANAARAAEERTRAAYVALAERHLRRLGDASCKRPRIEDVVIRGYAEYARQRDRRAATEQPAAQPASFEKSKFYRPWVPPFNESEFYDEPPAPSATAGQPAVQAAAAEASAPAPAARPAPLTACEPCKPDAPSGTAGRPEGRQCIKPTHCACPLGCNRPVDPDNVPWCEDCQQCRATWGNHGCRCQSADCDGFYCDGAAGAAQLAAAEAESTAGAAPDSAAAADGVAELPVLLIPAHAAYGVVRLQRDGTPFSFSLPRGGKPGARRAAAAQHAARLLPQLLPDDPTAPCYVVGIVGDALLVLAPTSIEPTVREGESMRWFDEHALGKDTSAPGRLAATVALARLEQLVGPTADIADGTRDLQGGIGGEVAVAHSKAELAGGSDFDTLLRRGQAELAALRDMLMEESHRRDGHIAECLAKWADRIVPPPLGDIPPSLRAMSQEYASAGTEALPFAHRCPIHATEPLPPPQPQPPAANGYTPQTVYGVLTPKAVKAIRRKLREIANWHSKRRRGEPAARPAALALGRSAFQPEALGRIWDLRTSTPQLLDTASRAFETHLGIDHLEEAFAACADQELIGMVRHGVVIKAQLEPQIVICPNLLSLYDGVGIDAVAEEMEALRERGWYGTTCFIPFAPWRSSPRGAVPRPNGGPPRGVGDMGAPHTDLLDSDGTPVVSVNVGTACGRRQQRLAGLTTARWHPEDKPALADAAVGGAILRVPADLSGQSVISIAFDFK